MSMISLDTTNQFSSATRHACTWF